MRKQTFYDFFVCRSKILIIREIKRIKKLFHAILKYTIYIFLYTIKYTKKKKHLQRLQQSQMTPRVFYDWFMTCHEVRFYPRDNSQGCYRLYRKNCKVEKPYWENQSEFAKT